MSSFNTSGQVRDEIQRLIDSNDRVATLNVIGDTWATNWTDDRTNWLHQNMGTMPVNA